jgi:hypothetical protein
MTVNSPSGLLLEASSTRRLIAGETRNFYSETEAEAEELS